MTFAIMRLCPGLSVAEDVTWTRGLAANFEDVTADVKRGLYRIICATDDRVCLTPASFVATAGAVTQNAGGTHVAGQGTKLSKPARKRPCRRQRTLVPAA